MSKKIKFPVTDTSSEIAEVPDHFHVGNINQLTNSLHGDGFYPFKGTVVVDTVTRNKKDVNGEVLPDTGKTIKIRDYAAIIDGALIFTKGKGNIKFDTFTQYTVQGSGTVYITLEPKEETDYEGEKHKQHEEGVFGEDINPPAVDSGKVLVAKLTNVPASGTIDASMIDNSVKDYLHDVDLLYKEFNDRLNEARVDLLDALIDEFNAFKAEITGDMTAVEAQIAVINTTLTTLQTQVTVSQTDITNLYSQVATLNNEIYTVITPQLTTLSNDLSTAVSNLSGAITNNEIEINLLKTRVSSAEGIISILQTEVEAPTTGLLDRVTDLENNPVFPPELETQVNTNTSDITTLQSEVAALGQGAAVPDVFIHSLVDGDIASSNQIAGTLAVDGIEIAVDQASNDLFVDDFNLPDGPVDPTKWDVVGIMVIDANQLKTRWVGDWVITKQASPIQNEFNGSYKIKPDQLGPSTEGLVVHLFHGDPTKPWGSLDYWNQTWFLVRTDASGNISGVRMGWFKFRVGYPAINRFGPWYSNWNGLPVTTVLSVKVQSLGRRFRAWVDDSGTDVLVLDINDTDLEGIPYVTEAGIHAFRGKGEHVDDFKLEDVVPAAYFANGTFTTSQLPAVSTISAVKVEPTANIPGNTGITYDVSVDGGVNWTNGVTSGVFTDFLANPGTDLRVRVNFTATDTTKTPVLTELLVTSKGKFATVSTVVKIVNGVGASGTIDLVDTVDSISSVKAYVTATGAPATKTLLEETTDYTISGSTLTCVTDQSANKLEVIYVLKAS